ncbi:unnamed protein product [Owenia fusiformis]|uniref:Uncharacterized protein n=1 Tax=Owenia fusiformis TaxID=6347 RepID=A0A8J1UDU5_OWEFU|nr:unnamed protein product [Owenia fusiformis]
MCLKLQNNKKRQSHRTLYNRYHLANFKTITMEMKYCLLLIGVAISFSFTNSKPISIKHEFRCPTLYGLYPDLTNCSNFYQCAAGVSYHKTCYYGLLFNPARFICDWPRNVVCAEATTTTEGTTTTREVNTGGESHTGTGEPATTPEDGSGSGEEIVTDAPAVFVCPERFGLYEDETDCYRFWQCSYGVAYSLVCPENLIYNAEKEQCDYPGVWSEKWTNGECADIVDMSVARRAVADDEAGVEIDEVDGNENETEVIVTDFKCPEFFGLFTDPEDCTKWWHCAHNTPFHMDCPLGLHFNTKTSQCDWPENARCGENEGSGAVDTTVAVETYPPPTWENVISEDFKCPLPTGLYLDPEDCSKFYHCSNDIAYHKDCPLGQHFDFKTIRCDLPEVANCPMMQA